MKILFAATPAPGHFNPLLALARLAQRRGDDVLFATSRNLAPAVEAAGCRVVPLAGAADLDFSRLPEIFPERASLPPGIAQLRFDLEHVFLDTMVPQAETLRAAIEAEDPDLIVVDNLFCGALPVFLDRRRRRPPIVACGITFLCLDRPDRAPVGLGLPPARDDAERARYAAIAAEVDAGLNGPVRGYCDARLAELGLPGLPCSFFQSRVMLADAYLQPTVAAFEYDFGPLPRHVHFVGALPAPPSRLPRPAWWGELDGLRRVVLVTQGTIANFDFGQLIEPTLAALADRDDLLVLVTTGGRPVEAIRGPIPANARLATFLDFAALLPRVDALVTNGGYATVSLALRAGVPIVASGRTEDKAEVGTRIAWSGVGLNLAADHAEVDILRASIDRVLADPSYRIRAGAMAATFAALDTPRAIFAIFDRLVAEAAVLSTA